MARNKTEQYRLNKEAFDNVIGDPYALEEVVGHYVTLNTRSSIKVVGDLGVGKATGNPATPSAIDFFVDVEKAIYLGLIRFASGKREQVKRLWATFMNTYVVLDEAKDSFSANERKEVEQLIGQLFMDRRIHPVSLYFRTIRRRVNDGQRVCGR